jgi:hypothetical protein
MERAALFEGIFKALSRDILGSGSNLLIIVAMHFLW